MKNGKKRAKKSKGKKHEKIYGKQFAFARQKQNKEEGISKLIIIGIAVLGMISVGIIALILVPKYIDKVSGDIYTRKLSEDI